MMRRPRPHSIPVRPSIDDAEGPDFARLLTQTLRADRHRLEADGNADMADRVLVALRRDPGLIGERLRCAADRHRRARSAAGRVTAAMLVVALAVIAGRVEPARRGELPAIPVTDAVERDLREHSERFHDTIDAFGLLGELVPRVPRDQDARPTLPSSGPTPTPTPPTTMTPGAAERDHSRSLSERPSQGNRGGERGGERGGDRGSGRGSGAQR